jgi:hypothetical protein
MMQKAVFVTRLKYGVPQLYPNNDVASTLCELTGKKTASVAELKIVMRLGIAVEIVEDRSPAEGLREQLRSA